MPRLLIDFATWETCKLTWILGVRIFLLDVFFKLSSKDADLHIAAEAELGTVPFLAC